MPFLSGLFAAIGTAVAGFGSFITSGFIGKALINIGLNVALSVAKNLLFKPKAQPSGVDLDLKYGEAQGRKVLMGLVAEAGHVFYDNTFGPSNKYWQQVIVLSDFPCTALNRVWVDDELVSLSAADVNGWRTVTSGERANLLRFKFKDGWQTEADADLVANANPPERWTENHVLDGMCYVIAELTYNREKSTSAPKYLFEVLGAPLYNWRLDSTAGGSGPQRRNDMTTWVFTKNPIVMVENYHYGIGWNGDIFCGMDIPASDLPLDKWTIAANICDEIVEGEARFEASISIDCGADTKHRDNVEALMQSTGGFMVTQVDGIWPIVGTSQPIVAVLTDADLIAGEPVQFQRLRKMNELVNSISGVFPNPDNQWSPAAYKTARDVAVVAVDRSSRDINMNFPTVSRNRQASQLASTYYAENRIEGTMSCTVRPRWQVLEAGDWIRFDSAQYGSRFWRIVDIDIAAIDADGPRNTRLNLQEVDAGIYAPVGVVTAPVVPLPPGEIAYTNEMPDFAVLASNVSGADGRIAPAIRFSWSDANDPSIVSVRVEYRVKEIYGQTQGEIFSDDVPVERSVRLVTAGVVSNTVYEARHIIVADPARPSTASAWVEVTTLDTPANDVSVGLGQVRADVYGSLVQMRKEIDRLAALNDQVAGNASENTLTEYLERNTVKKTVGALSARVTTEVKALVDNDAAIASSLTNVEAKADDATASGLFKIEAQAGGAGILAQMSMLLRAETADAFKEGGLFLQLYDDGGTLKARVAIAADQFVVFDPDTGNEASPLVFEGGVLKSQIAKFGSAEAEQFITANAKAKFGTLAPGVEGFSIKT